MTNTGANTTDGVRLLSHRPSVLYKVEHLAEPGRRRHRGGGTDARRAGLGRPAQGAARRAPADGARGLFAVRLADPQALPLPAATLLDRARTDWFPEFLSHGLMRPHFQPIVDLASGRVVGREALMRGKLGAVEVRGGGAARRRRGPRRPLLLRHARPRGRHRDRDPAPARGGDPLRQPRPARRARRRVVPAHHLGRRRARHGRPPRRACASSSCAPSAARTATCWWRSSRAHRRRGALIALDDLAGGATSLAYLEALKPDFAKLDVKVTSGIETSPGRSRLVAALVECAHEGNALVVAEGVERVSEFEAMKTLGVDLGQGFYFGQPTERPMAVDPRLVRARPELARA